VPDATRYQDEECRVDYTADAAMLAGEVFQLPDGRAAVMPVDLASGSLGGAESEGVWKVTKNTSVVFLPGGRVYWDHSANEATYKKVNDRDFYLGRAIADTTAAETLVAVAFNIDPTYDIDLIEADGALSVATGTAAAGGFGLPIRYGSAIGLSLTATNEVQCVDVFSVDRFALNSNFIAEFEIRLGANGSTSAVDLSVGVANATSTSDADAIAESSFFHVDGGALDIFAESDDGTTEVGATDTNVDITAGSAVANRFYFWLDGRDPSNVKYYINGAEVLSATANLGNIALATGPLGLLVHLEKSTGTATAGPVYIDRACVRFSQK
jgi:predicted RecA/RadA family phage recombinase